MQSQGQAAADPATCTSKTGAAAATRVAARDARRCDFAVILDNEIGAASRSAGDDAVGPGERRERAAGSARPYPAAAAGERAIKRLEGSTLPIGEILRGRHSFAAPRAAQAA